MILGGEVGGRKVRKMALGRICTLHLADFSTTSRDLASAPPWRCHTREFMRRYIGSADYEGHNCCLTLHPLSVARKVRLIIRNVPRDADVLWMVSKQFTGMA